MTVGVQIAMTEIQIPCLSHTLSSPLEHEPQPSNLLNDSPRTVDPSRGSNYCVPACLICLRISTILGYYAKHVEPFQNYRSSQDVLHSQSQNLSLPSIPVSHKACLSVHEDRFGGRIKMFEIPPSGHVSFFLRELSRFLILIPPKLGTSVAK